MIALGSNSQTRAKILRNAGVEFIIRGCDFDEGGVKTQNPYEYVYEVTKGKFKSYLKNYVFDMPFVVADTVVCVNKEILLKAKDKKEAERMLKLQSGEDVDIITYMIYKSEYLEFADLSLTKYKFKKFAEKELNEYLKSDEWFGKAGACMVEGFCKPYIKSVEGFESTAMGLSIEKLLPFLEFKRC
ncbi:MAG: septum formation inhibitor Maf [Campylobacteraceae bacterium]|nr:septum formation inhibitor Maf [Campylobacteraceae bacterium]